MYKLAKRRRTRAVKERQQSIARAGLLRLKDEEVGRRKTQEKQSIARAGLLEDGVDDYTACYTDKIGISCLRCLEAAERRARARVVES